MQLPGRVENWRGAWALKSALLNATGSALDYALLYLTTQRLGWATLPSALLGLIAGAIWNFGMNRRFAFAGAPGNARTQAMRYAVGVGALLVAHAASVTLLRDGFAVPLFFAKPACDLTLLGIGQLLVFRYFVFPPKRTEAPSSAARPAAFEA